MDKITSCVDCANRKDWDCLAYPEKEDGFVVMVWGASKPAYKRCASVRLWPEDNPICSRFIPRVSFWTRFITWWKHEC